jgi:hypothetical protein
MGPLSIATYPAKLRPLRYCLILLVGTSEHNLQGIIRQWPLQRLGLVPWRANFAAEEMLNGS